MSSLLKNKFIVINGARLKAIREEKGVNQEDLSPKIGRSRQTIVTWEGKSKVKIELTIANKLVKALDISLDDLTKDKTLNNSRSFRDEIFEGDYIGLHKRVWEQMEANNILHRDVIRDLIKKLPQTSND